MVALGAVVAVLLVATLLGREACTLGVVRPARGAQRAIDVVATLLGVVFVTIVAIHLVSL